MGFAITYRSTRPVEPAVNAAIREAAHAANEGRTWLGCEPVHFYPDDEDGHLVGSSKPRFFPHPDDAASAAAEGLPDGTAREMLEILSELSLEHGVDWEISHDFSDGPVGFIRQGVCDADVLSQIEALADLGDVLGELGLDEDEF